MFTFVLVLVAWVFSLCLHEYAHARTALAGGDWTVVDKGYLSMNPLRYMHPLYSILMPLVFLALGGIGLPGGAVYIETARLRGRWWASAVSAAGPLSNAVLAVALAAVFHFALPEGHKLAAPVAFLCMLQVTAVLLNLLPIPPLDGYGIVAPHLSHTTRMQTDAAGRWAIWVVFILLWYVEPAAQAFWGLVFRVLDTLGIPRWMVVQGLDAFMFWRTG
jgi:Zn-dependent protease